MGWEKKEIKKYHCAHLKMQSGSLPHWVMSEKKQALLKVLMNCAMRSVLCKPEPLRFLGSGVWSRRITQEHRLVYVAGHERIDFVQARYHY